MNLPFTLAWRYLNGRKLRTFLTTLAVTFGVLVIFGMNIILPTMLAAFQANALAAGGVVDVTITNKTGGAFPLETAEKINSIEGVRAFSPVLARTLNLPADFVDHNPSMTDKVTAVSLVGVQPEAALKVTAYVIQGEGRFLQSDDSSSAVISQSLADAWGVKTGGTITLPSVNGDVALTIVGILPPRTRPGNEEVLVNLPQAQEMTNQPGQINEIDLDFSTIDQTQRDSIIANIESALGKDYQVGALSSGSEMYASIKMGQAAFNLFGVLALFMGGFIIFNTFRTVVAERRHDIGMLRAIGARRRTITGVILVEGLLQGLIGSSFGLLFGYLFGVMIIRLADAPLSSFIHLSMGAPVISPSLVVVSVLLGVGITILAGLIPAMNASKVTPMDALRPSVAEMEYKRKLGRGFIAGVLLTSLAILALFSGNLGMVTLGGILFLIGIILLAPVLLKPIALIFGKVTALLYARQGTSDLAEGSLTRNSSRVVITSTATMIGLAIVVALGGMTSSLTGMMDVVTHKSLGSDYLFMPPSVSLWNSDIGASPNFASQLQNIPGVGDISTFRFATSMVNGQAVSLLGINPVTFPKVSGLDFQKGTDSAYADLAHGRNMIVNGAFLSSTGAKVGESIDLITPNGEQTYKIVAQATDLLNAKVTTGFISQDNMAADFNKTEDVFIQMNLLPGVTLDQVDSKIKAVAVDYPQFTVIAGKEYIDQMLQLVNAVFAGMYFMLAFLALPSLIAMLNTLAISVIERTREIGMLRAVGATRKQVGQMITAEGLILAAVGTAFGILSGLYLGYVFVAAMGVMFPMTYSFPLSGILAGIAIGLLFGALAAFIPARQAARLNVVEAIRYE